MILAVYSPVGAPVDCWPWPHPAWRLRGCTPAIGRRDGLAGRLGAACHCAGLGLLNHTPRFGLRQPLSVTLIGLTVYATMLPQLKRAGRCRPGCRHRAGGHLFPGGGIAMSASPSTCCHCTGPLGIASYGLFAAAVVHAWLMMRAEREIRLAAEPIRPGCPADTGAPDLPVRAGRLRAAVRHPAGGPAVQHSCTAPGGLEWDHKSVFSVLSWLAFLRCCWGGHGSAGAAARQCACCMSAAAAAAGVGLCAGSGAGAGLMKYLLVLAWC